MKVHPEALTDFREARRLSKKELADQAGISLQYLCDLEQGRRPGTPAVIGRIADVLKVRDISLIENPERDDAKS